MELFPRATEAQKERFSKLVRTLIICTTLCITTTMIFGTVVITYSGWKEYKEEHLRFKKYRYQQRKYQDPSDPAGIVNDPDRYWYS